MRFGGYVKGQGQLWVPTGVLGHRSWGWVCSATLSLPGCSAQPPPSPLPPPFSILEVRVLEMETKHQAELVGARSEKEKLQRLVSRQSGTIEELEKSLLATSANTSLLQRQQLQLLESVQSLVRLVSQGRGEPGRAGRVQGSGRAPRPPERVPGCHGKPLCSAQAWVTSPQK